MIEVVYANFRGGSPEMHLLGDAAPIVSMAFFDARHYHEGQTRKFSGEPYFHHPVRVALMVARIGLSPEVVAAALLHDCVDDTTMGQGYVDRRYPPMTAHLVQVMSAVEGETYQEKIARTVAHSVEAALLKRCDIIENLSTLPPGHSLVERYIPALAQLHTNI